MFKFAKFEIANVHVKSFLIAQNACLWADMYNTRLIYIYNYTYNNIYINIEYFIWNANACKII